MGPAALAGGSLRTRGGGRGVGGTFRPTELDGMGRSAAAGAAGTLAREASAKQLRVFHFSRKHMLHRERFYEEAENAFQGKTR